MKQYGVDALRNVGLFSHGGAGKTSLAEAVLFNSGAINRLGKVDEGNTVSDFDPDEIRRHISINVSVVPFEWKGYKVNIIDTPGYADFVGEVKEGMRVSDAACILLDAVGGVEVGTEAMWTYADAHELPRMLVVNRMDRENADFFRVLEQVKSRFGKSCVALNMPIGAQASFDGVVDLISMKALRGTKGEEGTVPTDLADQAASLREQLVEAIAETDDELITKYLEGEELSEDELRKALRAATINRQVIPIVAASATGNKGVIPVMNTMVEYLPSPVERGAITATHSQTGQAEEVAISDQSPLSALVFKTVADPYVGKLTYLRVYTGTIHSDSHVWNSSKGRDERIGQLSMIRGKTQEPIPQIGAGDIGAVAKLAETMTGDTLSTKEHPLVLPPIQFPAPLFSLSVFPKTKADVDKMSTALARIVDEDPTIQVRKDPDTAETIVSGTGESHVEIAIEKMKRKFGLDVDTALPTIPYKETITTKTQAEYKHKKQTGGHGQYGHVFLELEPKQRGGGFEFAERVVGGSVPKNFIPAVEKGVNEAVSEGVIAGFPVVDVKVTLFDGSYHPVDSSEMSFKIASSQAFKKGITQARPVLLEPIMSISVTVPDEFTGDVLGDLNTKRARVLGMTPEGGVTVVEAMAPLAEVQRYVTDLRSLTQGRGTFQMSFDHYEEVPAHVADTVAAEAKKKAGKE
ncbi:MAG: elongation factor G [Chloroflexota bacterium]|nr:MAG: elongation factor G [Chloroflexota bacterium]